MDKKFTEFYVFVLRRWNMELYDWKTDLSFIENMIVIMKLVIQCEQYTCTFAMARELISLFTKNQYWSVIQSNLNLWIEFVWLYAMLHYYNDRLIPSYILLRNIL